MAISRSWNYGIYRKKEIGSRMSKRRYYRVPTQGHRETPGRQTNKDGHILTATRIETRTDTQTHSKRPRETHKSQRDMQTHV